jgi:titin
MGDAGGNSTIVKGNLIGTDATGTVGLPGQFDYANVYIRLGTDIIIGGPTAAERNVISGNTHGSGIGVGYTVGGTTAVATIEGNFIGTDVTGTKAIGNQYGLSLPDVGELVLGNVISGNTLQAIVSEGGSNETIQGNFIGTDLTGTLNLGNLQGVVAIGGNNWKIGGPSAGQGNIIAFNGAPYTIAIGGGTGNTIEGNTMHDNAALGIDLYVGGGGGVTPTTRATATPAPTTVRTSRSSPPSRRTRRRPPSKAS